MGGWLSESEGVFVEGSDSGSGDMEGEEVKKKMEKGANEGDIKKEDDETDGNIKDEEGGNQEGSSGEPAAEEGEAARAS